MNDSSHDNETEALRSDIDMTRRRMDDTMDALSERLQPQHLLDELLGFFRRNTEGGDAKLSHLKEKVTHSADTAMHAVIDTVKKNPMPSLLIGAGIAWMIYESRREKSAGYSSDSSLYDDPARGGVQYNPDTHYDRPLQYPEGSAEAAWSDQGGSKLGQVKDKLGEKTQGAADQVKDKLSHASEVAREKAGMLKERAGEKLHAVRDRASELGHRVGERTREVYSRTRERVVTTSDQHPLEVGLVCLAAGVIAGLLLPTPRAVHRSAGPVADRLRERTRAAGREMMEKGRHVAEAAVQAAKDEARSQGITPERMREQAGNVAGSGMAAADQTARQEGLMPEGNQSGSQSNDPSVARPV